MPAGIEFALLGSLRSAWSPQSSPDYLRLAWSLYYPARILWGRRAWSPQSSPRLASLPQASSDLILVDERNPGWMQCNSRLEAECSKNPNELLKLKAGTNTDVFIFCHFLCFFVVKSKKWEILFLNFNLVVGRRSRALVGANKKATKGWRHALTTALISFREVLSLLKQRNIECANLKKCQQTILDIFCISCNLVNKILSTYRVLQG